jgi:hypothetical protein
MHTSNSFTIAAAFYGLFFAVPLRSHFVVNQDLGKRSILDFSVSFFRRL